MSATASASGVESGLLVHSSTSQSGWLRYRWMAWRPKLGAVDAIVSTQGA